MIIYANKHYRVNQKAVIHKVPSEWKPIRNKNGKIVTAKIEQKAAVDFIGHIFTKDGPVPIYFDAKEIKRGQKWYLNKLEEHQFNFLKDCAQTGAVSFVLLGFWEYKRFFIFPFKDLSQKWYAWKEKTGPAHIKLTDPALVEIKFLDYLNYFFKKRQVFFWGRMHRYCFKDNF